MSEKEELKPEELKELVVMAAWYWKDYYEKWGIETEKAKELAIRNVKRVLNKIKMTKLIDPMGGGPTSWVWKTVTPGVDTLPDGGPASYIWKLFTGTVVTPIGTSTNWGWQSLCGTSCQVSCQGCGETTCETSCKISCKNCEKTGYCKIGCEVSCEVGCEVSCEVGCEVSCEDVCLSVCQICELAGMCEVC